MAMKDQCKQAVAQALGKPKLNQQEATKIEQRIEKTMTAIAKQDIDKWRNLSQADRLSLAAEQVAKDIQTDLARKHQIIAKDIVTQARNLGIIQNSLKELGIAGNQALDRLIAHNGDMTGIRSLNTEFKTIANEYKSRMWDFYAKTKGALGIFTDKKLMDDVVRERFNESTNNPLAKKIADQVGGVDEDIRVRFNASGGNIGDLGDKYGLAQIWSGDRLKDAGLQQWVDDAYRNIDRSTLVDIDGNFLDDIQVKEIITESFDSITMGGLNKLNVGEMQQGGGKVTNRMSNSRVLHWENADAWLEMHKKYGALPIFDVIDSHIDSMSKNIALVEKFGSNPNRAFEILAQEAERVDHINGIKTNILTDGIRRATTMYDVFANREMNAGSDTWNMIGLAYRAWNTGTMLGSALLASLSDVVTMAKMARMHNLSVLKLGGYMLHELNPLNRADRELSFSMGLAVDEITSSMGRFAIEDLSNIHDRASKVARVSNTVASTVMRASLLNAWTAANKRAWSKLLMNKYATLTKEKKWSQMEKADQDFLKSVGMNEATWEVMSLATPIKDGAGHELLTTQSILNIPDEKLLAAMDGDVKALVDNIDSQIKELNDRNALDDQRIASKAQRTDDLKQQLSNRLQDYVNRKDAKSQAEKQALQDRIDLIDAQKESAAALADMNAYMRTVENQDSLKGFMDNITQGKEIDRIAAKSEKLGNELQKIDNRVSQETTRLSKMINGFEKEIQAKFKDFDELLSNKKIDAGKLAEYEAKLAERLNTYSTRRDIKSRNEINTLERLKELSTTKQEQLKKSVEIDRAIAQTKMKNKTDAKIDSSIERNARKDYRSGESIGERIGRSERRIVELRTKMRSTDSNTEKAINQKFGELDKRVNAVDAEYSAYAAKVNERQLKRQQVAERLNKSIDGEKKILAQEIRNEAVKQFYSHVLDESGMAVIETGLRERSKLFGKTHGGSFIGFMARGFTQFKSFPTAFLMRHGTRAAKDGVFSTGTAAYLIPLAMGMGIMGSLSLQLGEIASGNNPMPMWDDNDPLVGLGFMTRAMMKGGGLTIMGDILAAGSDTSGRGSADFLIGPLGGDLAKLASLTSGTANQVINGKDVTSKPNQIYMFLKSKIPGQNLWWAKTAMNRLMFDDIQNMIAPDYQEKYKRKMQKQNRSQWWESGKGLDGINSVDFDEVVK